MNNVKSKSADLVHNLRCFKYHNKRCENTLKMMNSTTGIIVEGVFLRRFWEQGFDIDLDRDNKSVYNPEAMFDKLSAYATRYVDKPVDDQNYDDAVRLAFKAFGGNGSLLRLDSLDELKGTVIDIKSSGAPFFGKKGDWFESDFAIMQRVMMGAKAPEPCVAYHRVQHGTSGPKQRLVWGYPQSMTLLEARFARPLINALKLSRTPMAFGLRRFELAARAVPISNSKVRYGLDMSGFDSSIAPWLISTAFRILRTWFSDDQVDDGWEKVVNYFIHTPILMPDGYVYRKHKGVPSGSYFTQLIDSIVNYIVIQYVSLCAFGKPVDDDKLLVLGDDSLFGMDAFVSMEQVVASAKRLGFKVNAEKSDISRFGSPFQFLGHAWVNGIVDRPVLDIVKRMVFPEKPNNIKNTRERVFTRALGYYCDARSAHALYLAGLKVRDYELERVFSEGPVSAVTGWQEFQSTENRDSLSDHGISQANIGILM